MRRGLLSGHRNPKADDLRLPYEMPEDWFVRMGVARNWSAQDIADWLGRPETSVRQYIRDDNMGWRYLDDRLKDMNVTMDSDISEVQCRLGVHTKENYRSFDEIRERVLVLTESRRGVDPRWNSAYPGDDPPSPQAGTASQSLAGPSSSSVQYYGAPQMVAYHTAYQNYPAPSQSASQAGPAGPSLAGPSFWSSQDYGGPETAPRPMHGGEQFGEEQPQTSLGGRSRGREHVDNGPGHARGIPTVDDSKHLSPAEQQDIRVRSAGGLSINKICKEFYPDRSATSVQFTIFRNGWKVWSNQQSIKLCELHDTHGDNWAQISSELPGVWRTEDEVKARFNYLKGPQHRQFGRHKYGPEEHDHVARALAQGVPLSDMSEMFPFQRPRAIEGFARNNNYAWRQVDDEKLKDMVGDGTEVDWNSIAAEFEPPRIAEIVKLRWEYLQRHWLVSTTVDDFSNAGKKGR